MSEVIVPPFTYRCWSCAEDHSYDGGSFESVEMAATCLVLMCVPQDVADELLRPQGTSELNDAAKGDEGGA